MSFAALPPEVNSTRMYTGPGSGPMLAAATAWSAVAVELHAAATAYESTASRLTGALWLGPSAQAMAAAATRYAGWLSSTAAQTEQTATQARAAAAAYEAAFAMTVPPSVVAANRAQLMMLVSTNILGQNTAAIAATEILYAEMWAQDAAAMYGYFAAAAPAAQLTAFTPPPQATNPAGPSEQGTSGASDAAGAGAQQALSQLGSPATQPAATAALPAPAADPVVPDILGLDIVAGTSLAASSAGLALSAGAWVAADGSTREILEDQDHLNRVQREILAAIDLYSPLTPSRPPLVAPAIPPVSAAVGEAVSAGNLSVPMSWAANAPQIRSLAYTTPLAAPAVSMGGAGTAFSQMALAGMGGSALAGTVNRGRGAEPSTRMPATAAPAPPGSPGAPENPVTGIAAEIREFAALRDAGVITDEQYNEQKLRLLGHAEPPPPPAGGR